jgi:hypothetical protein
MSAPHDFTKLFQLTRMVRSKNAGPFFITVDIFFRTRSAYEYVRNANLITKATVAAAYGIDEERVKGVYCWDPTFAIKVTMHRAITAGGIGDDDCYGAAQHVPLMQMELPPDSANDSLMAEPLLANS